MANRTVKDAKSIKGTNPQYLVEKIIRSRIYDSKYWKEECFALTAELLVDKAMELRYIGGVYGGNIKVTPFLCLILKMLQIQPEKEIIIEFIKNQEFKYVRALGAFYLRLTGSSLDCYNYLEPLLNDYRKIRRQNREGVYVVGNVDEFVDELLREERACDIILPRLQKRILLEENNELQPRVSVLEEDDDDDDDDDDAEMEEEQTQKKDKDKKGIDRDEAKRKSSRKDKDRDKEKDKDRDRDRERDSDKHKSSRRDKDRDRDRDRDRERDRERDRDRDRRRDRDRERDRGDRDRDRDRHRDRDSDRHKSRRHDY